MSIVAWLTGVAGLALVAATLRDVFETVVVPGGSRASLHASRRLVHLLLPVWKFVLGRKQGLTTGFAPAVLIVSFVAWMLLLALGFGLLAYALARSFDPPLTSLSQAFYFAGSSLVTMGLSEATATGPARWVVLGAGFCGLAVMTMAVTYLLLVQSSIAERDRGVMRLQSSAGDPPSAIGLLEHFASLDLQGELPDVLRHGRDWCERVRQSHASHPSIIYFRSVGTGSGWPAAVGALLDLTLLLHFFIETPDLRGLAALLRRDATRMAEDLGMLVGLDPLPQPTTPEELLRVEERLKRAGFPTRPAELAQMIDRRASDLAWANAMSKHLGKPPAVLLPG
jgi:Ion channel